MPRLLSGSIVGKVFRVRPGSDRGLETENCDCRTQHSVVRDYLVKNMNIIADRNFDIVPEEKLQVSSSWILEKTKVWFEIFHGCSSDRRHRKEKIVFWPVHLWFSSWEFLEICPILALTGLCSRTCSMTSRFEAMLFLKVMLALEAPKCFFW